MPARITDLTLRALEPGHQVRDTVLQGFGVRRHKSGRLAYYAYRQGPRPLYKVVGGSELTVTQAREAAKHVLAEHTLGHTKERGKGFTINSAWPLYREHLKRIGRVAGTMRVYENNIARLSPEIRKKPLALLGDDPGLMTTEHERLSVKTPAAADSSAMTVQALYRWVAKRHDRTLPAGSPCADLNLAPKPAAKPQRTLMRDDMRAWWGRVQQLRDPVRVQGHLFALLSGLRVDSLCQTRWDDLHRKLPNTLHIPKPKFGPTRAFDLPLSQAMIACLKRVMAHCAATGRLGARPNDYIFMRPDGSGPIHPEQ